MVKNNERDIYCIAYSDTADVRLGTNPQAAGLQTDCPTPQTCDSRTRWANHFVAAHRVGNYPFTINHSPFTLIPNRNNAGGLQPGREFE